MNKQLAYYILGFLIIGFASCKKDATSTVLNENIPNDIKADTASSIIVDKDTTIISFGDIVIRYNKTSACFPSIEVFNFSVKATGVPDGTYYIWSFGDGNTTTGNSVSYSYQAASSTTANLLVMKDQNTMIARLAFPVKPKGKQTKPVPSFNVKSDFTSNENYITFNSTSAVNQGDISYYRWDWGDGKSTISSIGLIRYEFPTNISDKTYPVKLTIITNDGCRADTTIPVTIPAKYPIKGSFKAEAFNICSNETIQFTSQAENVPTGSAYEWDFSDGLPVTIGNPITYKYKYPNDYDVILSIKLNGRLIYITNKLVNSKGENPRPKASFEETLVAQNATTQRWSFNSRSTIPTSTIDNYKWDFGNGNTSNDYYSFIETTYNKENTNKFYKVQLIVTGNGCADTTSKMITVPRL